MVMSDDTFRAIEILRFLQEAEPSESWTAGELALVIQTDDEDIRSQLWGRFRMTEGKENRKQILRTAREIVTKRTTNRLPIPSLSSVRNTLRILKNKHWIKATRGIGYCIADAGHAVTLLDVLHAFGDDAAITKCTYETNPMSCPFMRTCKAHIFYKQLAAGLTKAYGEIKISNIASGDCQISVSVGQGDAQSLSQEM